eukprot:TRINITY_DN423_c0_g1_i8.p1 TRINITY_DN423_c0_g1~~TRINITY_DN423_c0_g1_i8.p1  ORF type:complete len:124 (-),score=21.34 TRINITY_DN423_c0_g1_i8:41-412(-)
MSSPDEIAKAFVLHYYTLFDSNRAGLGSLYQEGSMLTFEGERLQGSASILKKLTGLPFQSVAHKVDTMDAQPSPGNGILIYVTGQLQVDGGNTLRFAQVFNLQPTGVPGGFYVLNDLFRLVYG